jgi:hypothetical protein
VVARLLLDSVHNEARQDAIRALAALSRPEHRFFCALETWLDVIAGSSLCIMKAGAHGPKNTLIKRGNHLDQ